MARNSKKRKSPKKRKNSGGRSKRDRPRKGATVAVRSPVALEKLLAEGKPVLIDFWAPWCRPCVAMAPAFEKAAEEWQGRAHFLKIDIEQARALADQFGVRSIPTLVAMVGDDVVDTRIGATDATELGRMAQRAHDKAEGVGLGGRLERLFD